MSDVRTIFKYEIQSSGVFELQMPEGAEVLTVQMQRDTPCLWALVDPEAARSMRKFAIVGTGHGAPLSGYIGTFQMFGGDLVWHLFEDVAS